MCPACLAAAAPTIAAAASGSAALAFVANKLTDTYRRRLLRMNYVAIVVAAVAAFLFSSVYYGVLGQEVVRLHAANPAAAAATMNPPAWKIVVEILRTVVVAFVFARLLALAGAAHWKDALGIALLVWLGFSAAMWVGAILWENVPLKLAAIHSGDWLVKTALIAVILGVWRK